ncbi:MAG: fused MFS/spermidine synthase [Gemmatimonadota bacterium]
MSRRQPSATVAGAPAGALREAGVALDHVAPKLVYACFFFSGAASLIYQVGWLRSLELVFGSTGHAAATVLSAFMAGLALGSFLFGRWIRRWARPLMLYGWLEVGIALYALAMPIIFAGVAPLYRLAWTSLDSLPFAFGLLRFAVSFLVLLPPTVLMGATLPVLAHHCDRSDGPLVGRVGTLYGINTLGAVVGTVAAGFLLLPKLGYSMTIGVAVITNGIVAALAFILASRYERSSKAAGAEPRAVSSVQEPVTPASRPSSDETKVMLAFALSGFAAMMLEVGWTRTLTLIVGPSTYAFSIMLATFLAGLAAGSLLFSWGVERWRWDGARAFWMLAAASGFLVIATLAVAGYLPYAFAVLFQRWESDLSTGSLFTLEVLVSAAVIFTPTVAMGGMFPAGLKAAGLSHRRAGSSVGRLYAANTIGAVSGAAAAGFFFIQTLGISGTLYGAAFIYLSLGAVFGYGGGGRGGRGLSRLVRPLAIVTATLVAVAVAPRWDRMTMTSGIYQYVTDLSRGFTREEFGHVTGEHWELLYYREGTVSTVSVVANSASRREFGGEQVTNVVYLVDGKADASSVNDIETQLMLAHAPMFLHPSPRRVMVIGLATGMTAGSVLTHPVEQVDILEIEAAAVPASRLFDFVNGRPLDDPRTQLRIGDARSYLLATPERYDVIISEPSNPWMAGPANLFTREFFGIARRRLEPGGVFCQWLQSYRLDPELFRSVIKTFQEAFPYVYVFQPLRGSDVILVGATEPIELDVARLAARWNIPAVGRDLARLGFSRLTDVLAQARLGPEEVVELTEGARVSTDDNGLILFGAPRYVHRATVAQNDALMVAVSRGIGKYLRFPSAAREQQAAFLGQLADSYKAMGFPLEAAHSVELARERLRGPGAGAGAEAGAGAGAGAGGADSGSTH